MLNLGIWNRAQSYPPILEYIELESFDLASFLDSHQLSPSRVLVIAGKRRSRPVANALILGVREIETRLVSGAANSIMCHKEIRAEGLAGEESTLVVGVGGGSVLDLAKYHASECGFDYLAIPTSISSDGLVSGTSIMELESGKTVSCKTNPPLGILLDRELLAKSPTSTLKNGLGDILSNHSAILDWDLAVSRGAAKSNALARLFSRTAVQGIIGSPPRLRDPDFRERYINSILLSGLAKCVAGEDAPCDGSEHLIGRVIMQGNDARYGHGFLVGSIAPYIAWLHDESDRVLIPTARLAGFRFAFFDLIRRHRSFASLMDEARLAGEGQTTVLDMHSNAELQVRYYDFLRAIRRQHKEPAPRSHPIGLPA